MAQLGFMGLGIMGYPMARHLLKAGHEVALWTHSAPKAKALASENPDWTSRATVCATPKEVASRADFIFYCVGDTDMARTVTMGANGILEAVRPDSITADCSSISPVVSQEIAAAFKAKGASFLDAPCTGSKMGAENAALTFMIGGEEKIFERAKPYFEIMGKRLYHCGANGRGLYAKLSQNLLLGNLMQAFAESIVLATKNGIKPELMLDILDNSAAKSGLVSAKAPAVMARNFATNFSTKWLHKDVGLALASAKALDLPLPLTAVTEQMLRATIAKGYGDDDFCSVIRILEEWAKVEVKS